MTNTKLAPLLVLLGVTASVWGCGDDDKPIPAARGGSAGKGGSGGSAGSSGTAGKGGSGGSATGGTAGKGGTGGSATGGSAGTGGSGGSSGSAGTGGTSGSGGTAGTAGTGGSMGGEGGMPDAGGAGGEGGQGAGEPLTLSEACAKVCADQAGISCSFGSSCAATCESSGADSAYPSEYLDMMRCMAENVTTQDYEDNCDDADAGDMMLAPVSTTACETDICSFTCMDMTYVALSAYYRCNC
jgi:hypothetical protein